MAPGWAWRVPAYWPGGVRHGGGASPVCGFCMERGKADADTARPVRAGRVGREGVRRAAETVRRRVPRRHPPADRSVVAVKPR